MRIDGRAAAALAASTARTGRAAAGGATFKLATGEGREVASGRSAAPLATLDAILMLQSEEDPRDRRRRSARRGQDLLDDLDRLKAALLGGTVSAGELRTLADRVASGTGPSGDPALDAIVAGIELRAQVELAKLGRA